MKIVVLIIIFFCIRLWKTSSQVYLWFFENVQKNINRYITARGFEWTNEKTLIIGFSETVIYSGENRSFDIGYLNPISSHLKVS